MAILTFTPMLPVFVVPRVDRWFKFPPNHLAASQHRWPSRSEIIEMGAQFGSGVLAIWIVFGLTSAIPYQPLYLLFIPLIWVSVRHGLPGAALSVFAINVGLTLASCLRLFPLSKLKIDRSFIGDIETSSDAAAVATAVISLAKSLHLKVIAEGVQTPGQLAFLRKHGCDEIQGYYTSPPLETKDVAAFLRSVSPQFLTADNAL